MSNIEEKLKLYRKRSCNIENNNIEIENLKIDGLKDKDEKIQIMRLEIKKMQLENKKIDNILRLLSEKDYKVISLIYLEGKDKKKVAKELDRTKRQIDYSINKAVRRIEEVL